MTEHARRSTARQKSSTARGNKNHDCAIVATDAFLTHMPRFTYTPRPMHNCGIDEASNYRLHQARIAEGGRAGERIECRGKSRRRKRFKNERK